MEYKSTLLEHTLVIAGSTTDARSEWQGWPAQFKKRGWDNPHTYQGVNITAEKLSDMENNKLIEKDSSHPNKDSFVSEGSVRKLSLSLNTVGVAIFGSKSGAEHERLQDEESNERRIEMTGQNVMELHNLEMNRKSMHSEEAKEMHQTEMLSHDGISRSVEDTTHVESISVSTETLTNRYLDDFVLSEPEANGESNNNSWPRNASTSSMTGLLDKH
jgi:hypothetical protein